MGRPSKTSAERRLNVQLAPPAHLSAAKRALWEREFARLPPGYLVPADVTALLFYLDMRERYDKIAAAYDAAQATPTGPTGAQHKQLMEAAKFLHAQLRAIRGYPSTRTLKEVHGVLANSPSGQATGEAGDDWRNLFPASNPPKPKAVK